jgi:hypothetical protein
MQAKSTALRIKRPTRPPRTGPRLAFVERRAQIIAKAGEFFAEYGLTAQTRSLAAVGRHGKLVR